jgi:hypothetical protein
MTAEMALMKAIVNQLPLPQKCALLTNSDAIVVSAFLCLTIAIDDTTVQMAVMKPIAGPQLLLYHKFAQPISSDATAANASLSLTDATEDTIALMEVTNNNVLPLVHVLLTSSAAMEASALMLSFVATIDQTVRTVLMNSTVLTTRLSAGKESLLAPAVNACPKTCAAMVSPSVSAERMKTAAMRRRRRRRRLTPHLSTCTCPHPTCASGKGWTLSSSAELKETTPFASSGPRAICHCPFELLM